MFKKRSENAAEATLASMETLEDKVDAANDGLENIKLDMSVSIESIQFYQVFTVKLPLVVC